MNRGPEVLLSSSAPSTTVEAALPLQPGMDPRGLCYVIYTSALRGSGPEGLDGEDRPRLRSGSRGGRALRHRDAAGSAA